MILPDIEKMMDNILEFLDFLNGFFTFGGIGLIIKGFQVEGGVVLIIGLLNLVQFIRFLMVDIKQ